VYEFVEDLTSDVMFVAEASDLQGLLVESSKALIDVVCQRSKIEPNESVEIRAEGESPEELLHEWLSQLLTESDSEEIFFSKFEVQIKEEKGKLVAEGKAWGETYTPEKSGTVVKGVTYYNFSVKKTEKGYRASVVCDI